MSWDTLPKDNLEYLLSKLKTDVLDYKVDTEAGKGLSSNDYTTAEKNKLAGIAANATKVESSEINGNIKIDTVETVVYDDAEIQEVIDTSSTETDYANPLSLETMQAQTAKNTKIKLEPIQDLHGYDKPWVGGAGVNILPQSVAGTYSSLQGNITAVVDNNGIITLSGTAGNTSEAIVIPIESSQVMPSNTIYVHMLNTVAMSSVSLNIENSDGTIGEFATMSPKNKIIAMNIGGYTIERIRIWVASGVTISGTLQPMLCLDNTVRTFSPYKNICPISGRSEIDILGCGKNLLTAIDEAPGTQSGITFAVNDDPEIILSGTYSSAVYRRLIKDYTLKLEPGSTYTLSGAYSGQQLRLREWDVNGNLLATNLCNSSTPVTFTVNTNTDHVDVYLIIYSLSNTVIKPQLEKNSSQTDWEPYQESNNKTLDLPQTVYGGILDLESGILTIDKAIKDLSEMLFTFSSGSDQMWFSSPTLASVIKYDNNNYLTKSVTSIARAATRNSMVGDAVFCVNKDGSVLIRYSAYNNDVPGFMNAVTGQKICYELATPFTLYISPEHLKLLKAQNTLTTSQYTQIKVTYRNGIFATLEELSDTANGIYDEISGDSTTVSGNPINFTTREKQKSKSTIIDLEPIQDLHGFTKPWIGGAGKNLLPMTVEGIKARNSGMTWNGNSTTFNNVTFTILTDTDNNVIGIKVNGTAQNANANLHLPIPSINLSGHILNGCPSGGGTNTYYIRIEAPTSTYFSDYGSGATITNNQAIVGCWIGVPVGGTASNQIFYPMIRLSSVTDATFEPYTNIASISGRSSVDIDGCGKNLCDNNSNIHLAATNAISTNGTFGYLNTCDIYYYKTSGYDYLTISCDDVTKINSNIVRVYYSNDIPTDGSSEYRVNNLILGNSINIDKNYKYIIFCFYWNNSSDKSLIQIEVGSSASLYEPYQESTDLTIAFGTTVYGGRLDVEKGELVVDRTYIDLPNSSNKWSVWGSTGSWYTGLSNANHYTLKILSNALTEGSIGAMYQMNQTWRIANNKDYNQLCLALTSAYDTSEKVANFITQYSVHAVLEFADAYKTTIQLTPQQVQLLKGINNISTTGTTITVTFKNGSVAHLDDLPDFTDYDKEKLASIDTLAITLDLLTHTLVVTQDI